jgi:ATP-dependent Lon protease
LPGKGPETESIEIVGEIPVLPLRNSVLFPGSLAPIDVGRAHSIAAVERANGPGKLIAIVAQVDAAEDGPDVRLHEVGCAARILKVIKLSKDHLAVILQGIQRIRVPDIDRTGPCWIARAEPIPEPDGLDDELLLRKAEALKESALLMIAAMPEMPKEAHALVDSIKHPGKLADALASHLDTTVADRQKVLETIPLAARVELVVEQVNQERARRA